MKNFIYKYIINPFINHFPEKEILFDIENIKNIYDFNIRSDLDKIVIEFCSKDSTINDEWSMELDTSKTNTWKIIDKNLISHLTIKEYLIDKNLPDSEFDIEGEYVFSIERDDDETIIGFYPKDGTNNAEWSMATNLKCHNDFIKRFKQKLSNEQLK